MCTVPPAASVQPGGVRIPAAVEAAHPACWACSPGTADTWNLRGVELLGSAAYLAVPPVDRTEGPGVCWRIPLTPQRYLTAPDALYAALRQDYARKDR